MGESWNKTVRSRSIFTSICSMSKTIGNNVLSSLDFKSLINRETGWHYVGLRYLSFCLRGHKVACSVELTQGYINVKLFRIYWKQPIFCVQQIFWVHWTFQDVKTAFLSASCLPEMLSFRGFLLFAAKAPGAWNSSAIGSYCASYYAGVAPWIAVVITATFHIGFVAEAVSFSVA